MDEFVEQQEFSFEGYQVVRREFFAHQREPAISIKSESITFNTACIVRFADVVYIQLLINPEIKKMVIRPCEEDDKDAIRCASPLLTPEGDVQ